MKYDAEKRLKLMKKSKKKSDSEIRPESDKRPEIVVTTQSNPILEENPPSPSQTNENDTSDLQQSDFSKKIRENSYGKKYEFRHGKFLFLVNKIPIRTNSIHRISEHQYLLGFQMENNPENSKPPLLESVMEGFLQSLQHILEELKSIYKDTDFYATICHSEITGMYEVA